MISHVLTSVLSIITQTNLHWGTVSLQFLVQSSKANHICPLKSHYCDPVNEIWFILGPHWRNWIREPYLENLSITSEIVFPNSFGWFCQRIWAVFCLISLSLLSIHTWLCGLKSQTECPTLVSWIPHPISIFDQPKAFFILQMSSFPQYFELNTA